MGQEGGRGLANCMPLHIAGNSGQPIKVMTSEGSPQLIHDTKIQRKHAYKQILWYKLSNFYSNLMFIDFI